LVAIVADGTPTHRDIATDAKGLYETAKDINSIAEAQDAVRRCARMIYYLATLAEAKQPPK
jgi:hypothetical protein